MQHSINHQSISWLTVQGEPVVRYLGKTCISISRNCIRGTLKLCFQILNANKFWYATFYLAISLFYGMVCKLLIVLI